MAFQAETISDPLVVEFRETLDALGIAQYRIARWFDIGARSVRRWQHGDRRIPAAVAIIFRLLAAKTITADQIDEITASPARTNGSGKSQSPASLFVEPAPAPELEPTPAPEQSLTDSSLTTAAKIWALKPATCRWPHGDPRHPDFYFCGSPAATGVYCARHHVMAYMPEHQASDRLEPPVRVVGMAKRSLTRLALL